MTLGVGSGNLTPDPQANIQYSIFTVQDEVTKKSGGTKVVITPDTLNLPMPLMTGEETKNKYLITPNRPFLPAVGSLPAGGANSESTDEAIAHFFNQLFNELPADIQKIIVEARTEDARVLKDVLYQAAIVLTIQAKAVTQADTESALQRKDNNFDFAAEIVRNIARIGKDYVESAMNALEILRNEPGFIPAQDLINDTKGIIAKAKVPEKDHDEQ